jgi:hypothetical protein
MPLQQIINQAGPLPVTATFDAEGDEPVYLEVNGSVWSQETDNLLGIAIELDGQQIGKAQIFSNASATHRAVVPAYIQIQLEAGTHTLTLSALGGTSTVSDYNDFYTAVLHI